MDEEKPPTRVIGLITRPGRGSAADTLTLLEIEIERRGLTIFARFDHAANARAIAIAMPAATVLVFGSPRAGTPLMLTSPLVALDLPLRILVWEDAGGAVSVSYADPAYVAARYGLSADLMRPFASIGELVERALSS